MNLGSNSAIQQNSEDMALARSIASGDQDALKTMMRRYNQVLFRTARSVLRNDFAAEEAVQEAYLLAYCSIQNYRGEAALSTWLIRIVLNLAIRGRRRQCRHDALFSDVADSPREAVADVGESYSQSPESAASNSELRRLLESHIDRLPDMYREIFVLRGVEELSVEATAEALDIPEATVRTRFFRARHLLSAGLARDIDIAFGDAFSFDGVRCDRIVAGVLERLSNQNI